MGKIFNTTLCLLVLLTWGCVKKELPSVHSLAPLPNQEICKIAVLPFNDETAYEQGGLIVYKIFMAELGRLGNFQLVPEGDIRKRYRQMHIYTGDIPDFEQKRFLGEFFGVDLIITGKVVEMAEKSDKGNINPQLVIHLEVFNATTGRVIWTTYHRRDGDHYRKVMHFGVINTMAELTKKMVQEIWASWQETGLAACTK